MIGETIRELREQKGIGLNKLARMVGISGPYLSQIESGVRKNPSYDVLNKIAGALEVPLATLIQDDTDKFVMEEASKYETLDQLTKDKISMKLIEHITKPDNNIDTSSIRKLEEVRMIPKVGKVAAGVPILAEENIEGYMPIDTFFLDQNKKYYLLKINGDSMNVEFENGTWVLVEKTSCLESGQLGVVLIDGGEATVKKVVMNSNMITLIPMSTNTIHQPTMYNIEKDDVRIQGRVIMALKTY